MLKVSKYLLRASYMILVGNQGQARRTELDGPLHINTSGRKRLEAIIAVYQNQKLYAGINKTHNKKKTLRPPSNKQRENDIV